MTSIAIHSSPNKTNRWLLIGAAVLAVLAGGLVFVALAQFDGSGNAADPAAPPDFVTVFRASRTIAPGDVISGDDIEGVSVAPDDVVYQAVTAESAVIGKVAASTMVEGQQLSEALLTTGVGVPGVTDMIPPGIQLMSIKASELQIASGLPEPGDHVNVLAAVLQDGDTTRVVTALQDVTVFSVGPDDTVVASPASGGGRPDDAEPNPDVRTVGLLLTPEQAQLLLALQARGELFLTLRALGDDSQPVVPPLELGAGAVAAP